MILNEEGKYNPPLPKNDLATELMKQYLQPTDYIAGHAVLVGWTGEDTFEDIPNYEAILADIARRTSNV